MASGKYSFVIEQGATTDFELQYKDSLGSPISLADHHARMQIRSDYGGTLIANLSSSLLNDGTGLNLSGSNGSTPVASGSIGVFISAATSSNFNFGDARYDIEIVSGSIVTRLLEGKVRLSKNVTV